MSLSPVNRSAAVLQHLGRALAAQERRYCRQVEDCRREFSKKTVHDSRVMARRLLSTIALLESFLPRKRSARTCAAIKEYLDIFGQLRDSQVQLAHVKRLKKVFPETRDFRRWLRNRRETQTRKARRAVAKFAIKPLTKDLARIEKDIRQLDAHTTRAVARARVSKSLDQAFAKALRRQQKIDPADLDTIHETRANFKRFRYMVETLAPLLALTAKAREAMHDFQVLMGDIQDNRVLLDTVKTFCGKHPKRGRQLSPLRNSLQGQQKKLVQNYFEKARRLAAFQPSAKKRTTLTFLPARPGSSSSARR